MRNKRLLAIIGILAVLAFITAYKVFQHKEEGITATGTIEITRADITPKVGGYIKGLNIKAGDSVISGQVVAQITRPDLDAQLLRDQLALQKAQAQLSDLEKGSRSQERNELSANLTAALSTRDKAQKDYTRYQQLYNQGAVSTQQLDAAKSALEIANAAAAALEQRLSLLTEGNRSDVIEAQRIEVERSKAIVTASQVLVQDTAVPAPISGLILSKNFEDNEYVNPGVPIATVGDMHDCWVKIYVASTQLGQISLGQTVKVKVDSFPDQIFNGVIKEINQSAEFTPRQSITQRERANQVFAVKVKLDNSDGRLKPGMPADVVIQ